MAVTADSRVRPMQHASTRLPSRVQAVDPPRTARAGLPLAPTLRRARRADAGSILAMCREVAGPGMPAALPLPLREALFDTPCRSWAWLADIGGDAVGMVLASPGLVLPQGDYCLAIDALYVRPAWRHRGIGGRLQVHVRAMAAEMGCQRLRLSDGSLVSTQSTVEAR